MRIHKQKRPFNSTYVVVDLIKGDQLHILLIPGLPESIDLDQPIIVRDKQVLSMLLDQVVSNPAPRVVDLDPGDHNEMNLQNQQKTKKFKKLKNSKEVQEDLTSNR